MDLREKILQAKDLKAVALNIPEWGVDVFIKPFSGLDRMVYQEKIASFLETKNISDYMASMAHLLILAIVDGAGKPIFQESDAEALQEKSNVVIERIAKKVLAMNGLSSDAEDDAEKN
jgi:hypothetical protein